MAMTEQQVFTEAQPERRPGGDFARPALAQIVNACTAEPR